MTWYISVHGRQIRSNAKHGTADPVVLVRKGKSGKSTACSRVKFTGGEVIYSADHPILKCGARLVIATETRPEILG